MIINFFYTIVREFFSVRVSILLSVIILFIIALILTVAAPLILGWVDRKFAARMQSRYGPMYVGKFGLLQNVADFIKLLGKDVLSNAYVDGLAFNIAPLLSSAFAVAMISIIPLGSASLEIINLPYNLLFIYIFMALSPLLVMLGGWGENNKFALLGAFRGTAQMITYELSVLVVFMSIAFVSGSFDISAIVLSQSMVWNAVYFPVLFLVFIIGSLAVIERAPFDMPESSQELQAGWRIEYSGLRYGLLIVGDYVKLLVISMLAVYLFLGGWNGPLLPPLAWFWIKTAIVILVLMSFRWSLNRPRIDQLLDIGWKWLLPLGVLNLVAVMVLWA